MKVDYEGAREFAFTALVLLLCYGTAFIMLVALAKICWAIAFIWKVF